MELLSRPAVGQETACSGRDASESINVRNAGAGYVGLLGEATFSHSSRRAGDSGGSSRFLGLPLRAEIRIPTSEGVLPLFVEHPSSYLQEKMCSLLAPSHLLFLHHPFAHNLIDRRLDETGSDLLPVAIAFPVIGHEFAVTST